MSKIFISYSHDGEDHAARVLQLAQQMRHDGLDCSIDQFVQGGPMEGWPRWMQRQIEEAQFVIVICTETYKKRFDGKEQPGRGRGADWEGVLVLQQLYESQSLNEKFIPVFFDNEKDENIPLPLKPYTFYRLPGDSERLYRMLTSQPKVIPEPLGSIRTLPSNP